jgi:hypothetical protein
MGSEVSDWGLLYAKSGFRVFPVKAGGKSPVYKNFLADATLEPKMVRQYFPEGTDRNLGLIAGEAFDAWDIEVEHLDRFSKWLYDGKHVLPDAPIASTGRGGTHILTAPTGVDGSRNLYLDGTHIGELKSRGGFILACPSETEQTYLWLNLPPKLAVPPAPQWLLALLERPQALRKTLPTRLASPDDVVAVLGRLAGSVAHSSPESHHRNAYLYWATRRAVEEGVPVQHVITAMRAAAIQSGLDQDDQGMGGIEKTIESAINAESVAA